MSRQIRGLVVSSLFVIAWLLASQALAVTPDQRETSRAINEDVDALIARIEQDLQLGRLDPEARAEHVRQIGLLKTRIGDLVLELRRGAPGPGATRHSVASPDAVQVTSRQPNSADSPGRTSSKRHRKSKSKREREARAFGTSSVAGAQPTSYPEGIVAQVDGSERFRDATYFSWLAADGLRSADPRGLFSSVQAAADRGENHKALYLARLLTELRPDLVGAWTNRAELAASLGVDAEARHAESVASGQPPSPAPPVFLPGAFESTTPSSLPDWAGRLALIADDVSRVDPGALVAVRSDISGFTVQQPEDPVWIHLDADEPRLLDLGPNLFVLGEARPMRKKSVLVGELLTAVGSQVGSAYAMKEGFAHLSDVLDEQASRFMARAMEVPCDYKGGRYAARTWDRGTARETLLEPITAGKRHALNLPVVLPWASGHSLDPAAFVQVRDRKPHCTRLTEGEAARGIKGTSKAWRVGTGWLPKLSRLRSDHGAMSPSITLHEVLLTASDLERLIPDEEVASRLIDALPDLHSFEDAFHRDASQVRMLPEAQGFLSLMYEPASAATYQIRQDVDAWFVDSRQR